MVNVTYGCDELHVIGLPLHVVNCEGLTFLDISGRLFVSVFICVPLADFLKTRNREILRFNYQIAHELMLKQIYKLL